ncbi:MAG: universal stress protein [Pseudomonadota bacterium]|nr:universal stress protein [Pseudomonadota bacterium]
MYKHLLVPIDGSPLASLNVEQAVALARDNGARVTFLHVRADFGRTGEGALLATLDPVSYARASAGSSNAWLARAAAAAQAAKVLCNVESRVGDRPHEAIHATALERGCDLIVMASHGRAGLRGRFAQSVTIKLLDVTTLPVLVTRVEANVPLTPEQRALAVIRDEHRSLAAVIHALQDALAEGSPPVDFKMLHAALYYLREFPERLHHRREEETLFHLLRQRAPASQALIAALELQHRDGSAAFVQLEAALAAFEKDGTTGHAAFAAELERYAQQQWTHMGQEEAQILPMASEHLTEADWQAIASAFESHRDPRFDLQTESGFASVFRRLMDLGAGRDADPVA